MNLSDFAKDCPGELVDTVRGAKAFLPAPLPVDLALPPSVGRLLGEAHSALGQLDEGGRYLPNPELFIHPLQKREAVLSSRIEGTRTTLDEAFAQEASGLDPGEDDDVREVLNYERALRQGVLEMVKGRKPSLALVRDLHAGLLEGVRGGDKSPGAYRTEQVWLGGPESRATIEKARFVPPPGYHVESCMDSLEKQMLAQSEDDALIRIALTHYQFEVIHPFLDGNGRIGRLLITLQLLHENVLERPWLYLSPFLEAEKDSYYRLLYDVSARGRYMEWVGFFLLAVRESARKTLGKIQRMRAMDQEFRRRLSKSKSQLPVQLLDRLQALPFITVPIAQEALGVKTPNSAKGAIDRLIEAGILEEIEWKPRGLRGRPPSVYRCTEIARLVGE